MPSLVFHSCMVTMCMSICAGASIRIHNPLQNLCTNNLILCGQTHFWCRTFVACSISGQLYHSPLSYMPRTYKIMRCASRSIILCSSYVIASYYFCLELWNISLATSVLYALLVCQQI